MTALVDCTSVSCGINNSVVGYVAHRCPFFPWQAALTSCVEEGLYFCIEKIASSNLFHSCRDWALKDIERSLASYLQTRTSALHAKKFSIISDCLTDPCPDIDRSKVHPREEKASQVIHSRESIANWLKNMVVPPEWNNLQEFLRFRKDDPREKLLYLSAEFDNTGALEPFRVADILSQLSQKYDIKFAVVKSPEELCEAIERSKDAGKLAHVVINGHGAPEGKGIAIGKNAENSLSDWLTKEMDYTKCFSGVHPSGKIVLFSCSAGAKNQQAEKPFDNIAQKIANGAKRVVVAAKDLVYSSATSMLSADTSMLFQQENILYSLIPFYNVNLFRLFKPHYSKSSEVINEKIHGRDLIAAQEIQKDLASKFLVSDMDDVNGPQEHLSFCKDDPRDKVLYLSAEADLNGALNPGLVSDVLGIFADKYDLKYKTISSFDEIRREVNDAAKYEDLAVIVINAHGTPQGGMLLSKTLDGAEKRMTSQSDLSCFSKLKQGGSIVLAGGSVGQDGLRADNLAQKIADISQRTVLAPTCPLYPQSISVSSVEPLIVEHPQHSFIASWWISCKENGKNIFKVFEPKQIK